MTKNFLNGLIAITVVISITSALLSIKTNQAVMSSCVTKVHWEESLGQFWQYGDLMGAGEVKLLPVNIVNFYQDRLNCIDKNRALGNQQQYDRQLELFPRLQMVDKVYESKGRLCADLISDRKVCSNLD